MSDQPQPEPTFGPTPAQLRASLIGRRVAIQRLLAFTRQPYPRDELLYIERKLAELDSAK